MTQALFILGMHRSGTSATARVVNLLGAELGSGLMAAATDNEKGFFEHEEAVAVHEKLLTELGHRWCDGMPLPEAWEQSRPAQSAASEIAALIDRDFASAPLWAIKDPRMSLLLPLWLPLLAERGMTPLAIVAWRNPLEVAASLQKRDGMDRQSALLCWLAYTLESLRLAQSMPYVTLSYDALMEDWQAAMARVGTALSLGWPVASDQAAEEINAFLTPHLRHHKQALTLGDSPVEQMVTRCLTLLETPDAAALAALVAEWHAHTALLAPPLRAANREIAALQRRGDDANHGAQDLAGQLAQLHQEHEALWDRLRDTEEGRKDAMVRERMAMHAMEQLRTELDGVYASQSWAMTAPLRKLNAALQRSAASAKQNHHD